MLKKHSRTIVPKTKLSTIDESRESELENENLTKDGSNQSGQSKEEHRKKPAFVSAKSQEFSRGNHGNDTRGMFQQYQSPQNQEPLRPCHSYNVHTPSNMRKSFEYSGGNNSSRGRGQTNFDQVPASPQSKFSRWNENREETNVRRDENGVERIRVIDKIMMFRAKGHRDLKLKPRYRQRDFNDKVKNPWL